MIDEIRKGFRSIRSGRKETREFGLIVGGVLGLIGALLIYRGRDGWWLVGLGGMLVSAGLVAPVILTPMQKAWMGLSVVLGAFMSRIVIGAVFFLVLTPIAIISRLSGKRFLERGFDPKASTYWNRRDDAAPAGKDDLERQF